MYQFWKFLITHIEKTSWIDREYIMILLAHMSLLLFSSILINAVLKSCHTPFTIHILHYAMSGFFWCWKSSSVAENLMLKSFQQSFMKQLKKQKKASVLILKNGLKDGTITYHLRKGTLKNVFLVPHHTMYGELW